MNCPNSDPSPDPNTISRSAPPRRIPRLDSLDHRLRHARDAEGRPIPLCDELLLFLEDPPPCTRDRWQEGADLCRRHGIKTSRMTVWRFYHAHLLQRYREHHFPAPASPPGPQKTTPLHDDAGHFATAHGIPRPNAA